MLAPPTNRHELRALPLWSPHYIHKKQYNVGSKLVRQKALRALGPTHLGDILDRDGMVIPRDLCLPAHAPANTRIAYDALIQNIAIPTILLDVQMVDIYVTKESIRVGGLYGISRLRVT